MKEQPETTKGMESPEQLAARWRVPLSWVYSRTNEIPFLKVGKYRRVPPSAADAWLQAQQKHP
jgi:hypothetical protein